MVLLRVKESTFGTFLRTVQLGYNSVGLKTENTVKTNCATWCKSSKDYLLIVVVVLVVVVALAVVEA